MNLLGRATSASRGSHFSLRVCIRKWDQSRDFGSNLPDEEASETVHRRCTLFR